MRQCQRSASKALTTAPTSPTRPSSCRHDWHAAAFDNYPPVHERPNHLRIQLALLLKHSGRERFRRIVRQHFHGALRDDRPVIVLVIDQVDRTSGHIDPGLEYSLMDVVTVHPLSAVRR